MTKLDEELHEELAALAASVPPPRRNDVAFARSVAEGVRAMVVDKDRTPHWQPARIEEVDPAAIAAMFDQPTTG